MKRVIYDIDDCWDCQFFQDYSEGRDHDSHCVNVGKDFDYLPDGQFPEFCVLEDITKDSGVKG